MQEGVRKGTGAVATVKLTTVANEWWGIPAGMEITCTWVYLSRLPSWEERLPAETHEAVFGKSADRGFKDFPFLDTFNLQQSVEAANLLASLAGTSVLWSKEHFSDITKAASGVSVVV